MARITLRNVEIATPARYATKARRPDNKRKAWRRRSTSRKLSEMERYHLTSLRQKHRDDEHEALVDAQQAVWDLAKGLHERLGTRHTVHYYHRLIMHQSRMKVGSRGPNRWNAFLSLELKRRNDEALLEGEQRIRVSEDVTKEIAATWKSMTEEEKIQATEARVQELQERTDNRKHGSQTFTVNAFHDTRSTLATVQQMLEDLYMRTGTETLMVNCRPTTADYMRPNVFMSSDRLRDFVAFAASGTVEDLAERMEGYCISGIQGVAYNYIRSVLNLKKEAAQLILSMLRNTSTRGEVGRMSYSNFDVHIMLRLGVVLDSWPLKKFRPPGEISSVPELETLIHAFRSGRTRFRLLTDLEWAEWKEKFTARETTVSAQAGAANSSFSSDDPMDDHAPTRDTPTSSSSTSEASLPPSLLPGPPSSSPVVPAMTPDPVTPSASTLGSPDANIHPRKRARQTTTFITVDVVTGPDGRPIAIPKRDRTTRKKTAAVTASARSSSTASEPVAAAASSSAPPAKRRKSAASKKVSN